MQRGGAMGGAWSANRFRGLDHDLHSLHLQGRRCSSSSLGDAQACPDSKGVDVRAGRGRSSLGIDGSLDIAYRLAGHSSILLMNPPFPSIRCPEDQGHAQTQHRLD